MPDLAQKNGNHQPQPKNDAAHDTATGGGTGAQRQAGQAAVGRMLDGDGKDVNAAQLARDSLFSVDASATLTAGEVLYEEGHVKVSLPPGARLSVRLDPGGLSLSADPGFVVDVPGPNLNLTSLRYDFGTAKFDVAGGASFDVLGVYASIARRVVDSALDKRVKPMLPSALQRPGYALARDPDVQGTVQALTRAFHVDGGAGAAGAGKLGPVVDPSAAASFSIPEDVHMPLGSDELELFIKSGTRLDLGADAAGAVEHPKLKQLSIRSDNPGMEFQSTGKGIVDALKGLTMKEVKILPGGRFTFDYDLRPEDMGNGLIALVELLGLAAGERLPDKVPDVKMQSIRAEIDKRLQAEVPARFRQMLAQYDKVLPGFSLMEIFGVPSAKEP